MTIEIHQPELEALIQQRLNSGRYHDVEDVLLQALTSSEDSGPTAAPQKNLSEIFAEVRGLADELDFTRDPSCEHDLTLVTRNVSDMEGVGVDILNPWELSF